MRDAETGCYIVVLENIATVVPCSVASVCLCVGDRDEVSWAGEGGFAVAVAR